MHHSAQIFITISYLFCVIFFLILLAPFIFPSRRFLLFLLFPSSVSPLLSKWRQPQEWEGPAPPSGRVVASDCVPVQLGEDAAACVKRLDDVDMKL